jgi:poly-gamma-glutamate synthesis protein (capsule biosynthesis protein)
VRASPGFAAAEATAKAILPVSENPSPPAAAQAAAPPAIWIDPALPAAFRQALRLPPDLSQWPQDGSPLPPGVLRVETSAERPITHWVYALVTPFSSTIQGVSYEDIRRTWNGEAAGPFAGQPLLMDESTYRSFSALWGAPAGETVATVPGEELLNYAWGHQPAWALAPFESLDPRWKVLPVDGLSPIQKSFDPAAGYPLTLPISLTGDPQQVGALLERYGPASASPLAPASNREPGRLTVVAMTGVTALVRATAYTMEQRGVLYPGKDVRDWLREADITHISNEVPFAQNCPYPNPVQEGMRFCSDTRYIKLLEDVGADIIELTGDHFADHGVDAMYYTLELYRERGWPYYGGGENSQQARQAVLLEHNGNRLAFIGCNAKGGGYAQAGPNHPGAVTCDFDWLVSEIARLRAEGVLPIATFQHFEYYTYQAQPNQERDSRLLAEAGAVIVSGSQAHQPQALEFVRNSLIHYGLGNLFFDQYEISLATRQGFIDRHIFYDGRYISTELLPILFIDYARPRPMTPQEQEDLLNAVFSASGW